LCLAGDVCLAVRGEIFFKAGLIFFLLGHVFYIFSFFSLVGFSHWISPEGLAVITASAGIFLWLRPHLKNMVIPVGAYVAVITIMILGAWAAFQGSSGGVLGKVFILAGALAFYLSDVLVARDKFIREAFLNRFIGLPLYYAGQFLLAFSIGNL